MYAPTVLGFLLGSLFVSVVAEADTCPKAETPALTRAEAELIALDHVGSGEVIGSERECERGRDVYEVEVRAKDGRVHEIEIAVDDGSIVDEEIDD
jgi:uncharacterized membrane protein YkoI